jgi:eukaryotic-like serine/threonine-protein kinase
MRQGDLLNGYTVVTKPTNAGGGKCLWAFATRDGGDYFIKEFLEPKWPLESSPGTAASKEQRRMDCLAFEQRHRHVMDRLKADDIGGGNIVIAEAFFREGTTYYKVTKRIDSSNLPSLVGLTARQKAVVMRTLALSLQQLHKIDVVHGDLKPDNVLVQKKPGGSLYMAKLIDFDDSYLAGEPPDPGTVGGDTLYGAPELLAYIQDDAGIDGADLTTAVDMFALGLMLHEYLTGQRPGFASVFSSPGEAVKAGQQLTVDPLLHFALARLIRSLTDGRPARRPRTEDFLRVLEDESVLEYPSSAAEDPVPITGASRASRVKFNLNSSGSARPSGADHERPDAARSSPEPAEDDAAPATRRSRVRIHLDGGMPPSRSSD